MEKTNLFLTGPFDAGKSYIAERALERWRATGCGPVHGFRTFKEEEPEGAVLVRLAAAEGGEAHTVARFSQEGRALFPEVFDETGAGVLAGLTAESGGIVLMDELGFIENAARRFQAEVLRVLDLPLPVIGVLRAKSTPFLDSIRAREDVQLVQVTEEKRQEAAGACFAFFDFA